MNDIYTDYKKTKEVIFIFTVSILISISLCKKCKYISYLNNLLWLNITLKSKKKKNCQEWHLIQSTVKYSVKRVIAGKEAAFYKSLYFMNGKTYIKEIFGNSFKHNKTYFH